MIGLLVIAASVPVFVLTLGNVRAAPSVVRCRSLYQVRRSSPESRLLPASLQRRLTAADISNQQVHRGLMVMRGAVGCSVVLALVGRVELGLGVLFLAASAPILVVLGRRDRRKHRLLTSLPDALELVSRSLRSGSSVLQAVEETIPVVSGPLGSAFGRVIAATSRGEPLRGAFGRLADQSQLGEVRVAVAALTMAAESGSGPSRALDGVAQSLRDGQRLHREVAALTSQARTSAVVLIALPIVFVASNAVADPSSLSFLLKDDLGRFCLGIGLALDVLGWFWMSRLVKRVRV